MKNNSPLQRNKMKKPFVVTCKMRSKCKKNEKQLAIVDRMRNNSQTPTQVITKSTLQNIE